MSDNGPNGNDELIASIVRYFRSNPRATYSEAAREIGVGESVVRRRVTKLVEDGVLTFYATADTGRFPPSANSLIMIDVEHGRLDEATAALERLPEVHYLGISTGDPDLVASVVFQSDDRLAGFLYSRLQEIDSIRSARVVRIMRVIRRQPEWPLANEAD